MVTIPITDIVTGGNVRHDVGNVDDLAASIDRFGLLQPLNVAKRGDEYLLIAGHRRLAALQQLGEQEVEVTLNPFVESDEDRISMQYAENVRRKDLSAYEQMQVAMSLKEHGMKQADVASELGISKGKVSQWQKVVRTVAGAPNYQDAFKLGEEALVELAESPALVEGDGESSAMIVENVLRSLVSGSASSVRQALGGAEREAKEVRILQLLEPMIAELHERGVTFVANFKDLPRNRELLAKHSLDSNYGNQLGFDHKQVDEHRNLPCHMAVVTKGWVGPALEEYCTKPNAHRVGGKSEIKEASADEKQRQREQAKEMRRQAKEVKQQRMDLARQVLGHGWTAKQAVDLVQRVVRIGADPARVVSKALGLDPIQSQYGNYRDHHAELDAWVASLPKSKQVLAPVMVLAAYMWIEDMHGIEDIDAVFEDEEDKG